MAAFVQDHWVSTMPFNSAATQYTTDFGTSPEDPISEGGIYLVGQDDGVDWNNIQRSGGHAFASAFDTAGGGVADGVAQLKRTFLACAAKQFSRGTIYLAPGYSPSVAHEDSVFVNLTIGPKFITGYECYLSVSGSHTLVRWNGVIGNFSLLASNNVSTFTSPVDGDVMEIQHLLDGTLNCYQNGILRTTANDTTYFDGNPGLGNNPASGGTAVLANYGFKRWTGGSL